MAYEHILYSLEDGVARISLNDPKTMNGVTEAMGHEMVDAFDHAAKDARAVLVTGEGKGFCSGANLAAAQDMLSDPMRDVGGQLDRAFNPVIMAIKRMEQPVVTAIRGPAAGYGAGLAAAGDIVLMADNAFFFCAFCHVGLVPDGGATYLLAQAVGRVRAMQMMLLGDKIDAQTALDWGLATKVVPEADLDAEAMKLAKGLAVGPRSLGMIKRMAWDALDSSLETALQAERRGQRDAGRTEDFLEGVNSFLEKRKPVFKGR
ncbi:enoyl-CoA hydratase-related protein [Novosphingobium mangrovi (ex Huang et al. 2023)]|uniref:Enoyl-CoA hydratase-related protein n=1 Tax=Novosphingobium mangrovi (ex Huang et al. 2023) TaxID=2976432 RepID=A0ABT2I6U4_9SPHN|nr:enoyl-CoA hydratase-related protein [Novosphingobium mangrovi (ex Huang et al. 2023)]MCT2400539.1 enoyl-CoA hydratase-related protein [Novosphingobium mangrovi (ex Huang et al. 2023)]